MTRSKTTQLTLLAITTALLVTAVTVFSSSVRFAYLNPELHLVLEVSEALVALLTASLAFGRYRRSMLDRDLLLSFALGLLGTVNFVSVLFALTGDEVDTQAWGILILRLVGATAFARAALTPVPLERSLQSAKRAWAPLRLVGVIGVCVMVVFGVLSLLQGALPDVVSVQLEAARSARPVLEGHPFLMAIQGLSVAVFAAAAIGFMAAARHERDDLWLWFGVGAVFATGARINYLLFPSLYSDYVYTGDVLRLAFYLLLMFGAAREIRTYWEGAAEAAVAEERRALARQLHDGVAQELVFIAAQSKRLERGKEPDIERGLSKLSSASERAVAGARRAIRALVASSEETLVEAITEVAGDFTRGAGLTLDLDLDRTVDVPPAVREGLLRIMGEAIRNSIRHSGASIVTVTLSRPGPICFSVMDDGSGFDSETSRDEGFGLIVMEEQASALGGRLEIYSEIGRGTKVEVTLDG